MGKAYRFFQVSALGLALVCVVLASQPAYAEIAGPSLSCGDVTLTEGTKADITCTFMNTTSGDIIFSDFSASATPRFRGDSSDVATSPGVSGSGSSPCTAGGTVSAGHSCKFAVGLTTGNPAGETDNDSGSQQWEVTATFSVSPMFSSDFPKVTVNDPPPSTAPEPSSVLLLGIVLGSGLLGALGLLRRKLL